MKALIFGAVLVAFATALPAEEANSQPSTKQKRGLLGLEHAPTLLSAGPLLDKSYSTPIIHTAPVVTRVFEAPPAPLIKSYQPIITGPLIARGFGPHIYGKTLLSAPIYKPAPIYTAPIYTKPIITHAPILSYGPKLAAPIALGPYGHGW